MSKYLQISDLRELNKIMRKALYCLLAMLLSLTACERSEEILPAPAPRSENPPPPTNPKQYSEEEKPTPIVNSELYQYGTFRNMPYRFLAPRNYDAATIYPVHIFLHGIGERGTDNEKQLSAGAIYFQADSVRKKYPAFIVYPQCPTNLYWFSEEMLSTLEAFVDSLKSLHEGKNQISIGGFSMGGYGTFAMVAAYPDLFEAAIAIAGDGDETQAERMVKTRWQLFAGAKDLIVPSARTEKMARALESAGASVYFKLYPTADHNTTLHQAFLEADFYRWIFDAGPAVAGD